MGFYIRKGFNFGPLRLNLSRSGLGASVGVKGARIGVGPRGTYIHLGREGLYYKRNLGTLNLNPNPPRQEIGPSDDGLLPITSVSATTMSDSSGGELLAELNCVQRRTDRFPIILVFGGILIAIAGIACSAWVWVPIFLIFVGALIYARQQDVLKGTAVLQYNMEDEAGGKFLQIQNAFNRLAACQGVWHIDAAGQTDDWKRNAGVNNLTKRSSIRPIYKLPPKVQCNIKIPALAAGSKTLYFFPDRLLVYDPQGVGAVPYSTLQLQSGQVRFVETDPVPQDAVQLGTTWQYVNKKGGPDRRFSNNRQLPIMLYGELFFTSFSGLKELFSMSVPDVAAGMVSALSASVVKQEANTTN